MSRVRSDQKYVNIPSHKSDVTGAGKVVRIHTESEDYHRAKSLSSWLFVKYDMTYSAYKHKSRDRRYELRKEYEEDTGRNPANELFPEGDPARFSYAREIISAIKSGAPAVINDAICFQVEADDESYLYKDCVFFWSGMGKWKLVYISLRIDGFEDDYDPCDTRVTWFDSGQDRELIHDLIHECGENFLACIADAKAGKTSPGSCENIKPYSPSSYNVLHKGYHAAMLENMGQKKFEDLVLGEAYAWHLENVKNGTYK